MQAKVWWQSKTLWANALLIAAFILDQITHTVAISPDVAAWLAVAVATVNMLLRLVTNTGLSLTPPTPPQDIPPG